MTLTYILTEEDTVLPLPIYRRVFPGTGQYYTNTDITGVNVTVRDAENTGSTLLASTAMTYDANLKGYKYNWTFGAALNGVMKIDILMIPTRAGTTPAALAGDEAIEATIYIVRNAFNHIGFAITGVV